MTIPPFVLDDIRQGTELLGASRCVSPVRISAALLLIESALAELKTAMNKPKNPGRKPNTSKPIP